MRPQEPALRADRGERWDKVSYRNERQVAEAVHSSEAARSEVFLETKIWISDYGYDETLHGFEKSARKLDVEEIDC